MTVQVDRTRGEAIVSVSGRVTIDSSPQLRAVLLQLVQEQAGAVINIDLSKVPYMDSSGIATALEALRSAQDRFVTLRMVGVSGTGQDARGSHATRRSVSSLRDQR